MNADVKATIASALQDKIYALYDASYRMGTAEAHNNQQNYSKAQQDMHAAREELLAALDVDAPQPNNVPLYTNERIDDIVDNHIFLDNGTSTYRVWEDRANKYLREMRARYEKELAFWQRYGVVKCLELVDAQGQGWMPLNVVNDDIVATDIQGRDIAPAKVLTTVVDGRHITMRFADSDKPFMSWEFLPHIRLCRRVDNPAPQVSEGMAMPDGVGWYAYDDHGLMRWVAEVTKWEVVGDTVNFCFATWEIPYDTRRTWQFKVIYPGKFYKLTMPWDATQPQEGES